MNLVRESISFERKRNPKETLFGLIPGTLLLAVVGREVDMFLNTPSHEDVPGDNIDWQYHREVLRIGSIDINYRFSFSLFFRDIRGFQKSYKTDVYRKLNDEEKKSIKKAFNSILGKRALIEIEKITGIKPII